LVCVAPNAGRDASKAKTANRNAAAGRTIQNDTFFQDLAEVFVPVFIEAQSLRLSAILFQL
jgi:hypothetical protein